jgi:NADH:ubiquinone oxidoreductase subunit 3 (subunit A)
MMPRRLLGPFGRCLLFVLVAGYLYLLWRGALEWE